MARKLKSFFEFPFSLGQIESYLRALEVRDAVQLELRLTFFQILTDTDWFLEICQPHMIDLAPFEKAVSCKYMLHQLKVELYFDSKSHSFIINHVVKVVHFCRNLSRCRAFCSPLWCNSLTFARSRCDRKLSIRCVVA